MPRCSKRPINKVSPRVKSLHLIVSSLALVTGLVWSWGAVVQPAAPKIQTIVIDNMKFTPAVIHVRPGDTVIFRNADLVPHTATEPNAKRFDSGMINRNDTWKFVATEEGTLPYRCMYHPDMTGTIIIEVSPARSSSDPAPATKAVEICGTP